MPGKRKSILERIDPYAEQIAQLVMIRFDQERTVLQPPVQQLSGGIHDDPDRFSLHPLHDPLMQIGESEAGTLPEITSISPSCR